MNIVEVSKKRYTTKYYDKAKKISDEKIEALCDVLRNSPSSVNSQPWHFFVIGSDEGKTKILPAITDFNIPRVTESSHTIVFCVKQPFDDAHLVNLLAKEELDGRFPNEEIKAAQDKGRKFFLELNSTTAEMQLSWESKQLYIALGHLLLAAATMDINSTAIEGFDSEEMDKILGLKAKGLKSVVVATLGYHSEKDSNIHRPKSRLVKEEIFTFL